MSTIWITVLVTTVGASERTLDSSRLLKRGGGNGNDWLTSLKIPEGNVLQAFLEPSTQVM